MGYPKLTSVKNKVLEKGEHYITLDYGNTYSDGSFHKGLDLVASETAGKGADYICAFADGKVTGFQNSFSGYTDSTGTDGMGNYVIIEHANGFKTRYMHLLKGSVRVKTGDKVTKGQVIAYMGNTGHSFGRHLHFDISYNKSSLGGHKANGVYYLDPKPYLKGTKTIGDTKTETKPVEKPTNTKKYTVKVNSVLNVRSGPGTNYKIVARLKNGSKVTSYEEKEETWVRIGPSQWVNKSFLV